MYNFKLKKISVASVFKFSLSAGLLLGGIFGIILGLISSVAPKSIGFEGGFIGGVLAGLFYGLLIAVANAFYTYVFNLISKFSGGIDMEIEREL